MSTARMESANRLDIYRFDKLIRSTIEDVRKSVSKENYDLIMKYERSWFRFPSQRQAG